MAITEEEKLRRKAAKLVRDRAHRARSKALQDAIEAAKIAPAVVQARLEAEKASSLYEAAWAAVRAKEDELRAQIAALQKEIEALRKDESLKALSENSRKTWDAWHAIEREHVAVAEDAFPDMKGGARWSASLWQIPPDVAAEMEAARANPESVLRASLRKGRGLK